MSPLLVDQTAGLIGRGQIEEKLDSSAKSLIKHAILSYDNKYGFGSMSCAIYDTAWVSLFIKVVDGRRQWLFEECFDYILDHQCEDGSWKAGASQVDAILNTAASLLSLKRHMDEPLQIQVVAADELHGRVSIATRSLQAQLHMWDVTSSTNVGFEIIVPSLLELLEQEGLAFDFEGRPMLERLRATKLSGFKPDMLYGVHKCTAIHSLESFIRKIDFDKVAHHKVEGALMASPSSTAAYLMNASNWDDESETYLRHVIYSTGKGSGGVPSAFPSTYFEFTWLLSTLMRAGYTVADLACDEFDKMRVIVVQALADEDWALGFGMEVGAI